MNHYVGGAVPANRMLIRSNTGENYVTPEPECNAFAEQMGYDTLQVRGMEAPPADRSIQPHKVAAANFPAPAKQWGA